MYREMLVKGFHSLYFLQPEFYISLRVDFLWSVVFNFAMTQNVSISILKKIETMLRSQCSWSKGAKALKRVVVDTDAFLIWAILEINMSPMQKYESSRLLCQ